MKNSIPEHQMYIESEDEEEYENAHEKDEDTDAGNDSDSSHGSRDTHKENAPQSRPNSYNPSWPQSYRQSIDLYSSLPSPSFNFLGTPTLSRLNSSFLSTSLTRRHTPEILPHLSKPLLDGKEEDEKPKERRSSHSLLPRLYSRKSSSKYVLPDGKVVDSHGLQVSRNCSYGQSVLNGINVLCGVGILSTPYAVKEGGWFGLSILLIFAILSFYTGILLRACIDSCPGIETYPDIGQAAFGTSGRIAISVILYVELYACCIEYIILESDNLSSLFPNAHINFGVLDLKAEQLFAVMAALIVLPTLFLKDLRILSYISALGVVASFSVAACLFWVGTVDRIGFETSGTTLNLPTLPVAIGLYGYCYSGHAVFPNIYSSMKKPNQYPAVLLGSFGFCTLLYAAVAVFGYLMFGDSIQSQFTLNLPKNLVASKIAVWTIVVNPLTKYALTMSPVALCLEELIPSTKTKSYMYSILIRTALVISTLILGLTIPFFGLVMALIGSFFTMLVTLILPCACYLIILKGKTNIYQRLMCIVVIGVGVASLAIGTYIALAKIINNLQ